MEKRIAVYVRVSTMEQSTELQVRDLLDYLKARQWNSFQIYEDKATGTNGNRPALKQLLKDAKERKVDVVICWKLDRLFRSLKDLVNTVSELKELGIDFISLKDHIDLGSASGRLMCHMLASFAEFEVSLIRERVRAGLRNAKAKGKTLGRPKLRNDNEIIQLRSEGMSLRMISKKLSVSLGAVQRSVATQQH